MRLFLTICYIVVAFFVFSQNKPTLIVQVTIENTRYDDIRRFWKKFSEAGFKKIIDSGTFFVNAHYNYLNINSASSYATLACGSYPAQHGIISKEWYDRISNKSINCVDDDNYKTTTSTQQKGKSPSQVNSLSWSDQLRISSFKMSKVYSVAINDFAAILVAGKLANAAYWFDTRTSDFVTSTYYEDKDKQWVKDFNSKKFADIYLSKNWETTYEINQYFESLPDNTTYETGLAGQKTFPYNLSLLRKNFNDYTLLLYTPFANTLIKDFAINLIMNEYLGKDPYTDVLFVNFSATSYANKYYSNKSVEIEDIFIKLDKDLAHFINFIESYVGKQNVVFIFTSDKGSCENTTWLNDINISTGVFEPQKAVLLTSSYLRALYGLEDWVSGFYNNQIYLNTFVIDKNKQNTYDLQNRSQKIIAAMTGVGFAIETNKLFENSYSTGIMRKAQNSFFEKRSGDIFVELQYGWRFNTETDNIANCSESSNDNTHVPVIFYGKNIKKQTIYNEISMDDIAVTLSFLLNTPLPTKATGKPLQEILKFFE